MYIGYKLGMQPRPYFLQRPPVSEDVETLASFETLYYEQVAAGTGDLITYTLEAPKWQFLCYLTDTKDVLLHGSVQEDIAEFELRQAVDAYVFGNQRAIYAASDGIWPLYFAIVNTKRPKSISRLNACSRLLDQTGRSSEPHETAKMCWGRVKDARLPVLLNH